MEWRRAAVPAPCAGRERWPLSNLVACGDDPVMIEAQTLFSLIVGQRFQFRRSKRHDSQLAIWTADEAYDVSSLASLPRD